MKWQCARGEGEIIRVCLEFATQLVQSMPPSVSVISCLFVEILRTTAAGLLLRLMSVDQTMQTTTLHPSRCICPRWSSVIMVDCIQSDWFSLGDLSSGDLLLGILVSSTAIREKLQLMVPLGLQIWAGRTIVDCRFGFMLCMILSPGFGYPCRLLMRLVPVRAAVTRRCGRHWKETRNN